MRACIRWIPIALMLGCKGETKDLFFVDTTDSQDDTTVDTDTDPAGDSDTVEDSDTVPTGDSDTDVDTPVDTADTDLVGDSSADTDGDTGSVDSDADTALTQPPTPPPDTFDTGGVIHPFCSFDTSGVFWNVPGPAYPTDASFIEIDTPCTDASGPPGHFLLDLDGDHRDELIIADACDDSGVGDIGETHWEVFTNDGTAHPGPAADWPLPGAAFGGAETFDARSKEANCIGDTQPAYDIIDIDGDDLPELVVTESCTDDDVGVVHWLVFENTGTGFSNTATTWEVPGARFGSLHNTSEDEDCGGDGTPAHDLLDMDGDGRLDLLVTQDCSDLEVGEDHWLWFKNIGTAFADNPGEFALPGDIYLGDGNFLDTSAPVLCNGIVESPSFDVFDLDGDGLVDLIVTDECDAGGNGMVGENHWNVFFHAGVGFSPVAFEWDVPGTDYDGGETFELTSQAQDCGGTDQKPLYATIDMDGNGRPDLLILDECDSGGGGDVGERWWTLYKNLGDGFRSAPGSWLLPGTDFPGNETFDTLGEGSNCSGSTETPSYDVRDLNGDGLMELVLTDVCDDDVTGENGWVIYYAPANCLP